MKPTITSIWRHASACLVISPLALLFGAGSLLGAVAEAFSSYADHCAWDTTCHEPRGWVMLPLALLGLALLTIAATTLLRGLYLTGRHIQRKLGQA
jgi:hypothetical protein